MRSLITGAAGQLGSDLGALLPDAVALTREQLSITDADGVLTALRRARPEVVFNCAAYNAVDRAESEPEAALAVNFAGAQAVARACAEVGARLVHFSTNYVFSGAGGRAYGESDAAQPLSAYGRSKWLGERAVLDSLPSALVVRSAGLFGVRGSTVKGGSFPARILEQARRGERLRVVADQRLNPTYTGHLAAACIELVASGSTGLLHLVAGGCCSWHELALESLRLAGLEVEVEPITTRELAPVAQRPLNGCLHSERVPALAPWQQGLRDWFRAAEVAPLGAGEEA